MEFRIKNELGFCEYTGIETDLLVKIIGGNGETGWLSRKAVEDVLRIMMSFSSVPAVQAVPVSVTPGVPVGVNTAHGSASSVSQQDAVALEVFDNGLKALMMKNSEGEKGQPGSLSEVQIFDFLCQYRQRIKNKDAMYRILNKNLGMHRERFDMLMERPAVAVQFDEC